MLNSHEAVIATLWGVCEYRCDMLEMTSVRVLGYGRQVSLRVLALSRRLSTANGLQRQCRGKL